MKRLHVAAVKIARGIALDERGARLLCRLNRRGRILMFHGLGTPDYTVAVFRDQLRFLTQLFRVVPLAEIVSKESTDTKRPKLALTFDDGLKNNFTKAYPVLKEFGAPATFFVCPGLVDSGRWLWTHECRARLSRMDEDKRDNLAIELEAESSNIESIVQKLKYLPYAERITWEDRLRVLTTSFVPTGAERLAYDVMDWSDLKALDPALIDIGGHSTHHEILTRISESHLEEQVGGCKDWLERELGRPVRNFCYPDGAYNSQVTECVARHFELAVTTEKGWVAKQASRLLLPRISTTDTLPNLAWRVQWPNG